MKANLNDAVHPGKSLDHVALQTLLQQRYPFLMVDKICDYRAGAFLHAVKAVTCNEPFFQGHFPGNPIMPGVMIIEALAQAACVLFHLSQATTRNRFQSLFLATSNVQFRKPVVPGDLLHLEVSQACLLPRAISVRAKARLTNGLAAKGELLLMVPQSQQTEAGR